MREDLHGAGIRGIPAGADLPEGTLRPELKRKEEKPLHIRRKKWARPELAASPFFVDEPEKLLGKWNALFYWLPIEELIRTRQQEYYDALGKSDMEVDSSAFVELMLEIILDTLKETRVVGNAGDSNTPIRQDDGTLDGVLEREILALLKKEPSITQKALSKKLNIPYRTLQRKMKELQKYEKIERIGGKRYGYWDVK